MFFDRIAVGIQRHARMVVIVWIAILCVSVPFAVQSWGVLSYSTSTLVPEDAESEIGSQIILEYFPTFSVNASYTPILVIYYEDSAGLESSLEFIDALKGSIDRLPFVTELVVMDPTSESGEGIIVIPIIVDKTAISDVSLYTQDIRDFVNDVAEETGFEGTSYVTGASAISYDLSKIAVSDVMKIDPFSVLMILILIGLFFRSFVSSAVPPMAIGIAFSVTMVAVLALGQYFEIFFVTNVMVLVTMLGVGCDYCIFIIARYREGLRSGLDHEEAVHQSALWAGESITISGLSAAIGFGGMAFSSYSMMSILGIVLAIGVLTALVAALTLIPAILQLLGDRIFWPTKREDFLEGGKATRGWYARFSKLGERYFGRSAKFSIRHAKAIAIAAVLVSVPAVYVISENEESYDIITSMLCGESRDGIEYLGKYAEKGLLMPNYSIIEYNSPIAEVTPTANGLGVIHWTDFWNDKVSQSVDDLCAELLEDPNIAIADGPFIWSRLIEAMEREGITDTDAKVQYVLDHLSSTNRVVFRYILEAADELETEVTGPGRDVLFNGFGPVIDGILYYLTGQTYDWDGNVEFLKSLGVTDPDRIVSTLMSQMTSEQKLVMYVFLEQTSEMGISNDVLVNGPGIMIDYVMNIQGSHIGGDFAKAGSGAVNFINVVTATMDDPTSQTSMESISWITAVTDAYTERNADIVSGEWEAGNAIQVYDILNIMKKEMPLIEMLVVVLIIILLFVVMRSYLIPFRSVITILMSISWTLALTYLVFDTILGQPVLWLIPIMLLVMCLGLGMDYDIFLTTRIRENVMVRGMTNDEAIEQALLHTGSIITLCGIIMGGALGLLMLSSLLFLQEVGFAMFVAIITDALVVRTYIVPALTHLLGDWNWKGPGFRLKKDDPQ